MASHTPMRIVALGLVVVATGVGGYWLSRPEPTPPIVGVVRTTEVRIAPEVGGQLTAIKVRKGDHVRAGEIVAELSAIELTASVGQARAALAAATADRNNVYAGVRATAGASPDLKIKNSPDKISCEYQLRERSVNKYLRWHDQITRSRGPKRNVTLSATRLSLDSSSLIDTSSLKDHLYVPQPTPKPTRWQPKGSSVFESTGRAR